MSGETGFSAAGSSRNATGLVRVFERSVWLPAPIGAVYAFHENPHNLLKISPPTLKVLGIDAEKTARVGAEFRLRARQFGVPIDWTGVWRIVDPPHVLMDGAVRAPFAVFDHEHRFVSEGAGTRMTDRVTYSLLGAQWPLVGGVIDRCIALLVLAPMFRARHASTLRWFEKAGGGATAA